MNGDIHDPEIALYLYGVYLIHGRFYSEHEFNFWFPERKAVDVEKLNPHLDRNLLAFITNHEDATDIEDWIRTRYS